MSSSIKRIILSRTDSIGDVVVSLATAAYIKKNHPETFIYFIGKKYTQSVIEHSPYVDYFIDRDKLMSEKSFPTYIIADAIVFLFPDYELAAFVKNHIPIRVGTAHRLKNWLYCNKRVFFNRSKSELHESQLNFYLLQPIYNNPIPSLEEIKSWNLLKAKNNPNASDFILDTHSKLKVILHPKSKGSAREWPMYKYNEVVQRTPESIVHFYISGTDAEGELIRHQCPELLTHPNVTDITGKMDLNTFVDFIGMCDVLVACSTGPLHIAAALNKKAIGIFPPVRPMHPGRWAPLGKNSTVLVSSKTCPNCTKKTPCDCIHSVTATDVISIIEKYAESR
ncbi:MAG: glycosyltransferase family 9 protein [Cytophagaceae bacterium]